MIFVDIIIIILLFTIFAFSHTWLASLKIKRVLVEKLGIKIAFYRLFYNITSVVFFLAFYAVAPKPDLIVYDLRFPFDIITFALQVLSIIGLFWATRTIDLNEFVGIGQIKRVMRGEYNADELDEKQTLRIDGAFKFVRHPIYLFSILFLGFRPTMNLFYLVMFICIVIYFYIGSIYEERKLVELFGDEYKEYQKIVPRMIPIKFKTKGAIFNRS
ncbi:MAG: isoprenylcysteine carboxylmethyltransferase family protein [Ignavibacteriales bacterium]|nr:isoprenylcysteine carboxylmethyltransferase family protein [Ignavibacteriales bacterium]